MSDFDTKLTVEAASWRSQANHLSEFVQSNNKDPAKNGPILLDLLLDLDKEKLQILLIVSKFVGIGAKELGKKIHLSRYAALVHAKQLIELNLLTSTLIIPGGKTGIHQAYSFHLAPGLTKEVIESAIKQKELKLPSLLNNSGNNQSNTPNYLNVKPSPQPSASKPASTQSQITDLASLKLRLLQLQTPALNILKLFKNEGITVFELALEIERDRTTVYKQLKKLLALGWITRERSQTNSSGNSSGKGADIYFLAPNLTVELIEAALHLSQPEMSVQQALEKETTIADPMPVSKESQNQDNTIETRTMPAESPQQSESSQSTEDTQGIPKVLEVVQELIVLYNKLTGLCGKISDCEEYLRTIGGEKAEKFIEVIRAEMLIEVIRAKKL